MKEKDLDMALSRYAPRSRHSYWVRLSGNRCLGMESHLQRVTREEIILTSISFVTVQPERGAILHVTSSQNLGRGLTVYRDEPCV